MKLKWRGRTVEPCRCWLAFMALEAMTDLQYATDFMWSETPYPAGSCEHVSPPVWRELRRLIVYRLTFGRFGRAGAEASR